MQGNCARGFRERGFVAKSDCHLAQVAKSKWGKADKGGADAPTCFLLERQSALLKKCCYAAG